MLIKIGRDYVDPAEIAAATYLPATKLDPERFDVTLRSGECALVYCSAAEFEAALIDAGVIEAPESTESSELDPQMTGGFLNDGALHSRA